MTWMTSRAVRYYVVVACRVERQATLPGSVGTGRYLKGLLSFQSLLVTFRPNLKENGARSRGLGSRSSLPVHPGHHGLTSLQRKQRLFSRLSKN